MNRELEDLLRLAGAGKLGFEQKDRLVELMGAYCAGRHGLTCPMEAGLGEPQGEVMSEGPRP